MRDRRRTPFFYLTVGASRTLRHRFPVDGGRTTALAIYAVMCELANEQRGREFTATRAVIAEYAGVGKRTLDGYGEALREAGLIERDSRVEGGLNLANAWALIDVADPAEEPSVELSTGAILDVRGGGAATAPLAHPVRYPRSPCAGVAQPLRHPLLHARGIRQKKLKKKEKNPPFPPSCRWGATTTSRFSDRG